MSDHHPDCSGWTFDYGGPFDCPGAPACEAIRDGKVVQLVDEVVPLNNLPAAPAEKDGSAGQSVDQASTWSELRFVWCPSPPRPAGGGDCR